jgi:hypothetical protein
MIAKVRDPSGDPLAGIPAGITREELRRHPSVPFEDKGDRAARVSLYTLPQGRVVLKEWQPSSGHLIRWWSRQVMGRELRHYQRLQGLRGIPRLLGAYEDGAFLLQYIDARHMRRLEKPLLVAGLKSLDDLLGAIHARRFVHLDLRKRANVLIDEEGQAWIIDLGQGLDCSRGLIRRLLFPLLRRIDRSAVTKFRALHAPETLAPAVRDRILARYYRRRTRWVSVLGRLLLRLAVKDQTVPVRLRPRHRTTRRPPPFEGSGEGSGSDPHTAARA